MSASVSIPASYLILKVAPHSLYIGRLLKSITPVAFLVGATHCSASPFVIFTKGAPSTLSKPSSITEKASFAWVILKPQARHALIAAFLKAAAWMPSQPSCEICFAPSKRASKSLASRIFRLREVLPASCVCLI